ncbi:MAG: hypothetical protein ACE5GL_10605, partial [Calditrichia bacterium]
MYDSTGSLIDPYQGSCNSLNSESWWISQKPYYDSAINSLMTHEAAPVPGNCHYQEFVNGRNSFLPGETLYTAAYYRDQRYNQLSHYKIMRPDGSVFASWSHASNAFHYSASYWYWSWVLPNIAPEGEWTFQAEYEGVTYIHT